MIKAILEKTMANLRKHTDIKLVTIDQKINYSVSDTNYHTEKCFSDNLLAIEINKNKSIKWINQYI